MNTPDSGSVLIGADSNCSKKSTKRRKLAWEDFCRTFSLEITQTSSPTFHHHNGSSESTIDYFLSVNCNLDNLRQFCTLDNPLNFSSHDPLLATIAVQRDGEEHSEKYDNSYTVFKRNKIKWDESKLEAYKKATDNALSEASEYWNFPEAIPHLCSLYSNLLVSIAEKTMGVVKSPKVKSKQGLKSSRKIVNARNRLQNCFKLWKKAGKPRAKSDPLRASYLSAKSDLQKLLRYGDNLKVIKHNNFIMSAMLKDKNKIYSRMKRFRGQKSSTTPTKL